jgi:hypothetical protein
VVLTILELSKEFANIKENFKVRAAFTLGH